MELSFDAEDLVRDLDRAFRQSLRGGLETIPLRVAAELKDEISRVASRRLNTSFQRFLSEVDVEVAGDRIVVRLGEFARGIEDGMPERDMRSMLSGPSARLSGQGKRYVHVPFRQATPRSKGTGGEDFAGRMDRDLYSAVKAAGELFDGDPVLRGFAPSENAFGYRHKRSVYAGLKKYEKPGIGSTRYISFRTLSDASDANAFRVRATTGKAIVYEAIGSFRPENIARAKV